MKNLTAILFLLIFTSVFSLTARAQNSDWIRVQSDNGEFSIEIPAQYSFFADKEGFSVSNAEIDYHLLQSG